MLDEDDREVWKSETTQNRPAASECDRQVPRKNLRPAALQNSFGSKHNPRWSRHKPRPLSHFAGAGILLERTRTNHQASTGKALWLPVKAIGDAFWA